MEYLETCAGKLTLPPFGMFWDVSNHVEKTMFDAVYKYFPVTFRSHPNDPYKITAQDLKDRLQGCIASNQAFASYAFPSLLEKLDSTSINVKVLALPRQYLEFL